MTDDDEVIADTVRLGQYVARARAAAGLTQKELAQGVGVSVKTINNLEAGRTGPPRRMTQIRLELRLGWEPGSIEAVLMGGEPKLRRDEVTQRFIEQESGFLPPGMYRVVGPAPEDAPTFRYQRPPGLTDQEWDELRQQHADYWDWLVERASRER